jgi:D-glycero-D-manno-heptose 1,7-bisphosphate phosphatase
MVLQDTSENERSQRVAFLDRDGTIIEYIPYLSSPHQVRLIDGAPDALSDLSRAGYQLVVVSNQAGIGRGYYTEDEAALVTAEMARLLANQGVDLDGTLHCPHTPDDECTCRKPLPGMANRAVEEIGVTLEDSIMVGDNCSDMEFGRSFGATNILVGTGLGSEHSDICEDSYDYFVPSIADVSKIIVGK